jgi:hypothetical protein
LSVKTGPTVASKTKKANTIRTLGGFLAHVGDVGSPI